MRGWSIGLVLAGIAGLVSAEVPVSVQREGARDRFTVTFKLPAPSIAERVEADGRLYSVVELPGFGAPGEPGTPALPVIDTVVEAPRGAGRPRLTLEACQWEELALRAEVVPCRRPRVKTAAAAPEFERRAAAYEGAGFRNPRALAAGTWYRLTPFRRAGADCLRMELFLYQFDPATMRLKYPRRVTVACTWAPATPPARAPVVKRTGQVDVLRIDGVSSAQVQALTARGYDIADRNGGTLTIYATPGERAELEGAGFKVEVLPNDAPRKARALKGRKDGGLGEYHDQAALTAFLQGLVAAYPDACHLESIGQSVNGRELWALKISDNVGTEEPDEPKVRLVGALHGDEPPGMELLLYFANHLLADRGQDARLAAIVDGVELWLIPLANPDGLANGSRYNAHGVDLNRSFPDRVMDPVNSTAGREPETAALMQLSAAHRFALGANFHTGALVVNYPYDGNEDGDPVYTACPDDALFRAISMRYAERNPVMHASPLFPGGVTNGADWYVVYGGLQDWSYVWGGSNDVTVEISNAFWPDASALPALWEQNGEALLAYVETVFTAVAGRVIDAQTGAAVPEAIVTVEGIDHPSDVDPATGSFHRMLVPGTYALNVQAPGYEPQTIANVQVAEGATTTLQVELSPRSGADPDRVLVVVEETLRAGGETMRDYYRDLGFGAELLAVVRPPSAETVRTVIAEAYGQAAFGALLIVGDTDTIPAFLRAEHVSDMLYGLLDAGETWEDYLGRDVAVGRLPVRTVAGATAYADIMRGFRARQRAGRFAWISHGYDGEECGIAEHTHQWVSENVVPAQAVQAFFPCGPATVDDFEAALAAGLDVVTYSGHGSWDSWVKWDFDVATLDALPLLADSPLVFSHACHTGRLEYERCYGEAWVVGNGRGAAFVGATDSTYWEEDDVLERWEFTEMLGTGAATIGRALQRGLAEVARVSPEGQLYHEIYHVLGDPTVTLASPLPVVRTLWDDGGNGVPEAGETGTFELVVVNHRGAVLGDAHATLRMGSAMAEVLTADVAVGDVAPGAEAVCRFIVRIDPACPAGHEAPASLVVEFDGMQVVSLAAFVVHALSVVGGHVTFEDSGQGANGVWIEAQGPVRVTCETDDEGRFAMTLVEGIYVLRAARAGYFTEELTLTLPPGREDLRLGLGFADGAIAPDAIVADVLAGDAHEEVATLRNIGTRPLEFATRFDVDRSGPTGGY